MILSKALDCLSYIVLLCEWNLTWLGGDRFALVGEWVVCKRFVKEWFVIEILCYKVKQILQIGNILGFGFWVLLIKKWFVIEILGILGKLVKGFRFVSFVDYGRLMVSPTLGMQ